MLISITKSNAIQNEKMPTSAISKDGQLRLKHVTLADSGIYECTASNNVGADAHDTIEVRVQCKYFRCILRCDTL